MRQVSLGLAGVVAVISASGSTALAQCPVSFSPALTYGAFNGPRSTALGDLNGDGHLDLVVPFSSGVTVSVLLGVGDGTFSVGGDFPAGFGPYGVAVADVNGDMNLDIITGDDGGSAVTVLLGNGAGQFAAPVSYPVQGFVHEVISADLNGDGLPDVIAAGLFGHLSVLLGNGNGFAPEVTVPGGIALTDVAATDFNGDGRLDLVAVNSGDVAASYTAVILMGLGDGTFQNPVEYAVGQSPTAVAVGDFDKDGDADLAISHFSGGSGVSILLGRGDGTFDPRAEYPVPNSASDVASSDFNCDGVPDLVVSRSGSSSVGLLRGRGDGTFEAVQSIAARGGQLCILADDINHDGRPEIITGHLGTPSVVVLRSTVLDTDGDGLLDSWESPGGGIDANGDGLIDLDLYAMGARPNQKDLFVEIDAMAGRAPDATVLPRLVAAFASAPLSVPAGGSGIALHLHLDETAIPLQAFPGAFAEFDALKSAHFGTPAERSDPNWFHIRSAKRMAFRYCIFGDTHSGGGSSGFAELPGNDFAVTLGAWSPAGGTPDQQAGTFMHELGHTLGLRHGGADNIHHKPNYYSVMNYSWQNPITSYATSWRLDYSRAALPALNEAALSETVGIAGSLPGVMLPFSLPVGTAGSPPCSPACRGFTAAGVACDWNNDGAISASVSTDINFFDAGYQPGPNERPIRVLAGHDDWANIVYNFRESPDYADGSHVTSSTYATSEMTFEVFTRLSTGSQTCFADLTGDDVVDFADYLEFLNLYDALDERADLNGDGIIDFGDYLEFLNLYEAGC